MKKLFLAVLLLVADSLLMADVAIKPLNFPPEIEVFDVGLCKTRACSPVHLWRDWSYNNNLIKTPLHDQSYGIQLILTGKTGELIMGNIWAVNDGHKYKVKLIKCETYRDTSFDFQGQRFAQFECIQWKNVPASYTMDERPKNRADSPESLIALAYKDVTKT